MKTSSSEKLHGYIEHYIECVQDPHHQHYRVIQKTCSLNISNGKWEYEQI